MLTQIMNRKLFVIAISLALGYFLIQNISFNSFNGITSTSDPLEILVVREDGLNDSNSQTFNTHFFIKQTTITETEMTGELYNIFNVININRQDFTDYFKGYQNIVFLSSDDSFLLKEGKNNWRKNQTVVYFSIDSMANENEIKKETKKVIENIKEKEIARRIVNYKNKVPQEIKEFMASEFGSQISLPNNFSVVDTLDGLLDIRRDFKTSTQRMIIKVLNTEFDSKKLIIKGINQIFTHVQGEAENSFAIIDDVRANVYLDTIKNNGEDIIETRGLWKIKNDLAPMGGPFVSYIFKDIEVEQALLISFLIFAPGEDKADHLLDAEAIGRSLTPFN